MNKRIIVILAASLILAGCKSGQTSVINKLPLPCKNADVCLIGMGIHNQHGSDAIIGFVQVKTVHIPKVLEVYATLYFKYRKQWLVQDTKTWNKGNLALPPHTRILTPELENFCAKGYWAIQLHIISISSTNVHDNFWQTYPGKAKTTNTVLSSFNRPHNFPGLLIKSCAK